MEGRAGRAWSDWSKRRSTRSICRLGCASDVVFPNFVAPKSGVRRAAETDGGERARSRMDVDLGRDLAGRPGTLAGRPRRSDDPPRSGASACVGVGRTTGRTGPGIRRRHSWPRARWPLARIAMDAPRCCTSTDPLPTRRGRDAFLGRSRHRGPRPSRGPRT